MNVEDTSSSNQDLAVNDEIFIRSKLLDDEFSIALMEPQILNTLKLTIVVFIHRSHSCVIDNQDTTIFELREYQNVGFP